MRKSLFLYGTLMGHADTPMARFVQERVVSSLEADAPGKLLAISSAKGWFPALVPGHGRVKGVLADLELTRADLMKLDRYEGREYRRIVLRVRTSEGMSSAQGWVWTVPPSEESVLIEGGDFMVWVKKTGLPILSQRNGT